MRKSLFTALVVAAGVASQAGAAWPPAYHITDTSSGAPSTAIPTTKLGYLQINLLNQYQLYTNYWAGTTLYYGVNINPARPTTDYLGTRPANRTWENNSYDYLAHCLGAVKYASLQKQVNNQTIIAAINAAFTTVSLQSGAPAGLFNTPNSGYTGAFSANAMLVVVNYDNKQQAPPYPSTEDNYIPTAPTPYTIWNAPYNLQNAPIALQNNGQQLQLNWPNQNYIAWGKPSPFVSTGITPSSTFISGAAPWVGARVFVLDPSNSNVNLRCFDVTPFFTLEEGFCWFCWDTMDRVTDGTITRNTTVSSPDPPCSSLPTVVTCGISGSGVTYFYWTVKFNNANRASNRNPNYLLDWYYKGARSFATAYGTTSPDANGVYAYGANLDDNTALSSLQALAFTVSGLATYNWSIQTLSDSRSWAMGTINMNNSANGYGYSPLCGIFWGNVSIVEYDKTATGFGGAWCLTP